MGQKQLHAGAHFFDSAQKSRSGGGQADAARIPVQQPEADFILQPVQLLLQGGGALMLAYLETAMKVSRFLVFMVGLVSYSR